MRGSEAVGAQCDVPNPSPCQAQSQPGGLGGTEDRKLLAGVESGE